MLLLFRQLINDCIPGEKEKLAYNVPFYYKKKRICFIWPPSLKWGNSVQNGVRFGFTSVYLLQDDENWLERGERKQVYWKDFTTVSGNDLEMLRMFLQEATMIDNRTK